MPLFIVMFLHPLGAHWKEDKKKKSTTAKVIPLACKVPKCFWSCMKAQKRKLLKLQTRLRVMWASQGPFLRQFLFYFILFSTHFVIVAAALKFSSIFISIVAYVNFRKFCYLFPQKTQQQQQPFLLCAKKRNTSARSH